MFKLSLLKLTEYIQRLRLLKNAGSIRTQKCTEEIDGVRDQKCSSVKDTAFIVFVQSDMNKVNQGWVFHGFPQISSNFCVTPICFFVFALNHSIFCFLHKHWQHWSCGRWPTKDPYTEVKANAVDGVCAMAFAIQLLGAAVCACWP